MFKGKPIDRWPQIDRQAWAVAMAPPPRVAPARLGSKWRPRTKATVAEAYGYALSWLEARGALDATRRPDLRWPENVIGDYIADLLRTVRPATAKNRLLNLERALAALVPSSDRRVLKRYVCGIEVPDDTDRKRPRLQSVEVLVDFGFELMSTAESDSGVPVRKSATCYRDGLQIGLLAMLGLRKSNFANLEIGRSFVKRQNRWWVVIAASETKNRRPLEIPVPQSLQAAVERYLTHYRTLLAGDKNVGNHLWISYRGTPQHPHSVQLAVSQRTEEKFGKPINPHLMRDCLATSIAIHDPENVRMAATLLGHSTIETTERHYNLARSVDASRHFHATLDKYREQVPKAKRMRARRK